MTENPIISLQNIACTRGDIVLFAELNLTASQGDLIHIRGENGSGKTSLLRIISGIALPDKGEILWNNTPIKQSESFSRDIAYLAHRDGIKQEFTALENLRFYQELYKQANEIELLNTLETLDIMHVAYTQTRALSFGQKRRLGFARLLLSSAKLWLLDEPFTGIDISGRKLLENICLKFLDQGGIIIMTHHAEIDNNDLHDQLKTLELSDFNPVIQDNFSRQTVSNQ